MLTFVTVFKKFKVEPFGLIQSSALYSWNRQSIPVLAADNEMGIHDLCPGVSFLKGIRTGRDLGFNTSAVVLPDLLNRAVEASETLLVGIISADVLITPEFMGSIEELVNTHGYETFLVATRHDIDLQFLVNSEETYQKALGLPRGNHGSADLFITSKFQWRMMLRDMPDFLHGRSGWANWIYLYASQRFPKYLNCTMKIPILHCKHDDRYRRLQEGVPVDESKSIAHNKALWEKVRQDTLHIWPEA
jgi:hypothetical protein